jgi:hypothetical protein
VKLAVPAPVSLTNATMSITVASNLAVEVTGDGFVDAADNVPAMVVSFVRGTQFYEVTVPGAGVTLDKYKNPKRDAITAIVPPEVLNQAASAWYIQVRSATGTTWSFSEEKTNVAILKVSSSASGSDQCGVRATGDFGLLDSPRADANQLQTRLNLNIAQGLDHGVTVFPNVLSSGIDPNAKDNCRVTPQTPVTGGVLDDADTVASGGIPNCMEINNGNKVDATTDGLIKGGTNPVTFTGRLDAAPSPICPRGPRNVLGENINDDVLSCFLQSGNIGSAINGTAPKFKGEIVDSPRFMFIPVLYASINPQNGFYPIQRFAGAFITEQTPTTTAGDFTSSNEPINGVPVGSQKVEGINVIPFELDRLPEQIDYDGSVIPYIGAGPKVVRLIK